MDHPVLYGKVVLLYKRIIIQNPVVLIVLLQSYNLVCAFKNVNILNVI